MENNLNIPLHWNLKKLEDVADYINGRAFKPSEWEKDGKPIIRIQNLNKHTAPYNYSKFEFEDKYRVDNGDLLFAWSASLGAFIWNGESAWLNQHIFKVIPKSISVKKYLYYFLSKVTLELYSKAHGSGMVHVTKGKFLQLPIPLPPLPEQEAIVSKIEELFSELEKGKQLLLTAQEQLKVYRQSLLKWAFEGKLTNNNIPDGQLPDGWKWVKLGTVIEKPKYGTSKKCSYEAKGKAVIRIPNVMNGIIDNTDLKFAIFNSEEAEKYKLNSGDLLTIRSNGSVDLVGKCALVRKVDEESLFAGYLIRLRPLQNILISNFLLNVMSSIDLRNQIESKAKSTSGVNNINTEELQSLIIPLPPLPEQERIVEILESKLSVCDSIEQTLKQGLQQVETLRQSILKKAFEGKLVKSF